MKAWDVIGYVYEADLHCIACAEKRFGPGVDRLGKDPKFDNEGNQVGPIFALHDDCDGNEYCGDCGEIIHECEAEP